MIDDCIVFESSGNLLGLVRPWNIRHTHFSRNPIIAAFFKAHEYVKQFGEGIDRVCRELNANGTPEPKITDNDFISRVNFHKNDALVNVGVNDTENYSERLTETQNTIDESYPLYYTNRKW